MSTFALPKGAWLPDRNGILHFHRDQPAPTWQQTATSRCGSVAGAHVHASRKEAPCDLCRAVELDYARRGV